jgi:TolA-binding protein
MYKAGLCHQKLGDKSKAAEAWRQLVSKYPRSNEAALARERLRELGQ